MSDDDEEFEDLHNFDDYYGTLNVSREASAEEINQAYRNFSRQFHPDKHQNPEDKKNAEILFNRIKKAYEVLSDPHSRVIYDNLGHKGLATEGWEIVERQKTPAELREEFERLRREREERRLQQQTNPHGTITVRVNATDIFNKYDDEFSDSFFPTIEVSGMQVSQSIECPLTTRNTAELSTTLNMAKGVGTGVFVITGRRFVNKGWLSMDLSAGSRPAIGFKGFRDLSQSVFCTGGLTTVINGHDILPGIVGTLGVRLDQHTVGYLTYNAGLQNSSMETTVAHRNEKYNWSTTLSIGVPYSFASFSYTHEFQEYEAKLRTFVKISTLGFSTEYGAEKKITKYSSVYAAVSLSVPQGVTLKLKLIRSKQSYIFPIHLSEEIIPAAVFYATVTPLVAFFVIKKAIIDPMNDEKKQRKIEKAKETNKLRVIEKRKEAETAISLMSATYDRIIIEEEKKKGLIIVSAFYGKSDKMINTTNEEDESEEVIDVKVPLQCMVKDSRLVLHKSSKCDLPGFYDPCMGEMKSLKIEYKYKENTYSITFDDKDDIRLPKHGLTPVSTTTTTNNMR
ncbi:dnaJ homolog subfamily C member 11 [Culicoides brevitarsis]|uniref:dnaJ homolog subfamily C member 11 n=1 Tax=Culicoides brevitarsis TaxID=469753 RepID=UPI00307B3411